jgi:hypothetical protein
MPTRRVIMTVVALVLLLAVGEAIPRMHPHKNLARYASNPPSLAVATAAAAAAQARGSALQRLLYPTSQVDIGVWPASCPLAAETAQIPNRVYYSRVHFYGIFGVRGPVLEVRCGGTRARWLPTA